MKGEKAAVKRGKRANKKPEWFEKRKRGKCPLGKVER